MFTKVFPSLFVAFCILKVLSAQDAVVAVSAKDAGNNALLTLATIPQFLKNSGAQDVIQNKVAQIVNAAVLQISILKDSTDARASYAIEFIKQSALNNIQAAVQSAQESVVQKLVNTLGLGTNTAKAQMQNLAVAIAAAQAVTAARLAQNAPKIGVNAGISN